MSSYDDDLAALDTATIKHAKVKSMAPGLVPYEETELDTIILILEHHKWKAAAANRLPKSPSLHTLITDSQATVCGDDLSGLSSPAKLLRKRDATNFDGHPAKKEQAW